MLPLSSKVWRKKIPGEVATLIHWENMTVFCTCNNWHLTQTENVPQNKRRKLYGYLNIK